MRFLSYLLASFAFTSIANAQLTYQLGNTTLAIDVVLDSTRVNMPWEIIWGPDDRLWMTDSNNITRWDPVTDEIDTLLHRHGNGLGMALHPDFPNTPIVIAVFDTGEYYAYSQWCEVSRFTYDEQTDQLIDEEVLFGYRHAGEHAAGRLLFDTTGHVLLTTADYYFNGPDTLFSPVGKTLRFATDGSVPPDNPRADHTWTWGHRNPQGLTMLPNGAVVNTEHGMLFQGNEINLIQRDENHGYPYFDGNVCMMVPDTCNSPTFTSVPPMWTFTHPPSGCEFYASDVIPEMQNKLITTILWHKGLMLFSFTPELDSITGEEYLEGGAFDNMWRNRDIAIRPDGSFYLITNDRMNARIRWVHPDGGTAVPEPTNNEVLRVWPNPASDRLIVMVPDSSVATRPRLFDAQGHEVPITAQRIGDRYLFDVEGLPPGLYAVRISDGHCARLVKQ